MFVHTLHDVLGPGLDVAGRAAFQQDNQAVAAEAAAEIGGRQLRAQQVGELGHEILAREHADGLLNFDEAVRLDEREPAHAALHGVRATFAYRGDHIALLQKARRGVVLDGIGELYLEIAVLLLRRGYRYAHGRLVLVVGLGEEQLERQTRTVREQRLYFEVMARPLALQAGNQRTLEGRMRLLLEQVHERRAGERFVARIAEQLEPGAIGIHDDAFLHVGDGVGRAFEKILQLLAILAGRGQRGRERALQAEGTKLTGGDRL